MLDLEMRRARREQTELSLILADVDFFKRYNDRHGHVAGDECLRRVAAALRATVRRPADLVTRYGGEEFAVILPNTRVEGACRLAAAIRQQIADLELSIESSDAVAPAPGPPTPQ